MLKIRDLGLNLPTHIGEERIIDVRLIKSVCIYIYISLIYIFVYIIDKVTEITKVFHVCISFLINQL